MRFCNKHCEKDAHAKKPTEKQPEDPSNGYAENLLKKEVEAEMKKNAKLERNMDRWSSMGNHGFLVAKNKDALKGLEDHQKNK